MDARWRIGGYSNRWKFGVTTLVCQAVFLVLFGILVDYDDSASPVFKKNQNTSGVEEMRGKEGGITELQTYYPMFQDVHVMIFIGFGFLMTFLKKYGFSSVGVNFLVASFVIQWSMIMGGLLHLHDGRIQIGITSMLTADFAAAAVLITFGAVLGKTSPLQMLVVAFVEIIFFSVNEWIGVSVFVAADIGGSMFVHTFGAYFGLAMTWVIWSGDVEDCHDEGSIYHSDIFSMIGTVFLWLFWPSFNSALAEADNQHRAVINTYLSLAACCVVTFAMSSLLNKKAKFDMVHIQNATLAGGVAVGTTADMMIHPVGALCIGSAAAILSVLGFQYLTPLLATKLKIHDTCGVNNLHGMPGIFAGIIGVVMAAMSSYSTMGESLDDVFPAREHLPPGSHSNASGVAIQPYDRSAMTQAGFQAAALFVTITVAVIGGLVTGVLIKQPVFDQPKERVNSKPIMHDRIWFEVTDDLMNSVESLDKTGTKQPLTQMETVPA